MSSCLATEGATAGFRVLGCCGIWACTGEGQGLTLSLGRKIQEARNFLLASEVAVEVQGSYRTYQSEVAIFHCSMNHPCNTATNSS